MADLRIVDAPVLLQESITDDVKMPTGGLGNFSIRLGDIVWYVVTKEQLANKNYVDLSSKGVKDSLDEHIADKNNPHNVTKAQVGLGNVDNTADVDKPVSNAVRSAITTATNDMATKNYVNQQDNLKADKATTLSGYGIADAYTKNETDSKIIALSSTTYAGHKGYATLAAAQAEQASLPANTLVEVTNDTTASNNGVYLWDGTTLTKSSYDTLTQAKNYADQTKIAKSDLFYSYEGGNIIGAKTPKYTNFGVAGYNPVNSDRYDSVVLSVKAGDILYVFNDKGIYSGTESSKYVFFAQDPRTNTGQPRVEYVNEKTQVLDTASGITYKEVTVPDTAKFMVMNTRVTKSTGDTTTYNWAVHRGVFRPSYAVGDELISKISGSELSVSFESKAALEFAEKTAVKGAEKAKTYSDINKIAYTDLEYGYTGSNQINPKTRFYKGFGLGSTYKSEVNERYDSYVLPVKAGDTLFIFNDAGDYSGTRGAGIGFFAQDPFANQGQTRLDVSSTTITDPSSGIEYKKITVPSNAKFLLLNKTYRANVQTYEYVWAVQEDKFTPSFDAGDAVITSIAGNKIGGVSTSNGSSNPSPTTGIRKRIIKDFVDMDMVRLPYLSTLKPINKVLSSSGIAYTLQGEKTLDSASNNLFTHVSIDGSGKRKLGVNIYNFNDDVESVGKLKMRTFDVPSAILTEPDSFGYTEDFPNSLIVHPSMAYSDTPIGGFKYWMIGSTYPPYNNGDALWEDEEVYVSNDAVNWQRVRSLYETNKSYTTTTLRLPPQSLVTNNARKHGFLPCPSQGDVIEMSTPAHNGAAARDREMVTLDGGLPWKHDPFIMIDGGYVYTYHTYHLPTLGSEKTKNRFIVCVRTNDGINWDVVRTDGSTMRLTEANSKTLFTKSSDGKYNYMRYMYDTSGANPEIVKYGEGDYELLYGSDFKLRHKGTTPYNFDWETSYPVQGLGSGHHPGSLLYKNKLYIVNQNGLFVSSDRGETLVKMPYFPLWVGGVSGFSYKRALCIGEGGKLIVADVQRQEAAEKSLFSSGGYNKTNSVNQLFLCEFSSPDEFIDIATNGQMDGYVDVQVCIVNFSGGNRRFKFYPAVSTQSVPPSGSNVTQRLVIDELDLLDGDEIYFYVTLNSRRGGKILFGGIDIS